MEIFNISLLTIILLLYITFKFYKLKQFTIKNQNTIMATLSDFQNLATEINTATQTIAAYVQGTGMSTADQDTALSTLQTAITALSAAIPTVTPVTPVS